MSTRKASTWRIAEGEQQIRSYRARQSAAPFPGIFTPRLYQWMAAARRISFANSFGEGRSAKKPPPAIPS